MLGFFHRELEALDPDVARLIGFEAERQSRKLILIPSESQAPDAVREALGSVFQNVYAEGYPDPSAHTLTQQAILDYPVQLAYYRRYSDLRYYKGVEYVDVLESLARRRAAEAFATPQVPPEEIWANVQPLSGSPANSAVYDALVAPGSTVMGMDLLHGGHLTHGSPANRSGKLYHIVSYGIDPATEQLDYGALEQLAREHKPEMIIAGFTSYPWMPDWARFRQIADSVGAYLLADIAHTAGMVAAQVVPSPIGHAHVVSFTTHKSLYGPRGACILTTDKKLAAALDAAVFPGEQGGPHVNAIAGMAVAFQLALTAEFRNLQQQVVDNARRLAAQLEQHGLRIPYGGTDTHMLLVDCKSIRSDWGVSPDGKPGTPLMGDSAARILDLAGVVLNRNTIPGDRSPAVGSGIRMGTHWVTQRGFQTPEIDQLAEIIARVLKATEPFAYAGRHGPVYRAKVGFDELEQAKWDVVGLASRAGLDPDYSPTGYPHHYFMHRPTTDMDGDLDVIQIEGAHARGFCNVAMTNDVYALRPGESQPTWLLEPDGRLMSSAVLRRPGDATTCFELLLPKPKEPRVAHWLRALSDGYVHMDADRFAKAPGPVVVRRLSHTLAGAWNCKPPCEEDFCSMVGWAFHKPYWIGQTGRACSPGDLEVLPAFAWADAPEPHLKRSPLHATHLRTEAKMAPCAGWEMPAHFTSVHEEHQAVRSAAGLFDISNLGIFEFGGENVHLFITTITTNDVSLLEVGQSQYSFLLDPDGHVLDDVWVYRLAQDRYWMTVNAANSGKDWAWINAAREGRVSIDPERPWARALGTETVTVRDLRDPACGSDMRVALALQGPRSRDILLSMQDPGDPLREAVLEMKRNQILHVALAGYDLDLSRTGYSGEPVGLEIFVHPAAASALWRTLLEAGRPFGVRPAGMAARNSLRIEAGLPLHGCELAGPLDLNPADAVFSAYVKLYKPFFVGKRAFTAHEKTRQARLVRFRLDEAPSRMPQQGDVVVSRSGRVVGAVTGCSIDSEGSVTGLAYIQDAHTKVGARLGIYQVERGSWAVKPIADLKTGDQVMLPDDITVIRRFLNKKE